MYVTILCLSVGNITAGFRWLSPPASCMPRHSLQRSRRPKGDILKCSHLSFGLWQNDAKSSHKHKHLSGVLYSTGFGTTGFDWDKYEPLENRREDIWVLCDVCIPTHGYFMHIPGTGPIGASKAQVFAGLRRCLSVPTTRRSIWSATSTLLLTPLLSWSHELVQPRRDRDLC